MPGHDTSRFVGIVDPNVVCSVCSGVIDDAVLGCPNGHTFCKGCLGAWRSRGHLVCPLCKTNISGWQAVPCLPLNNMIRALAVRCGRVDESGCLSFDGDEVCTWEGSLDGLSLHERSCGHTTISCEHAGCNFFGTRRRMAAHMTTCAFKPACCNGCGLLMPPSDMTRHLAEDCPEEPVPCLLASCGCEVRPRRKRQVAHLAEDSAKHAALCAAVAARLSAAEATIEGGGSWVPDEDLALSSLIALRLAAPRSLTPNALERG